MTITSRPSAVAPSLLGGSIELPTRACRHSEPRTVSPWTGAPGTVTEKMLKELHIKVVE